MRVEGFKKSYRFIFSLPSSKAIFCTLLFSSALYVYMDITLGRPQVGHVIYFLSEVVLFPLIARAASPWVFTWRRSYGLPAASLLLWVITVPILKDPTTPLISFFSYLWYMAYRGLCRRKWPLGVPFIVVIMSSLVYGLPILIAFLASIFIFECVIWRLNRKTEELGIRGVNAFVNFAEYILSNNREAMEEVLLAFSREDTVYIDCLKFFDPQGRVIGAVVVPYIHPGPFRNVGSAAFPSYLLCEARFRGLNVLVLHGVSSHERDLALTREAESIAQDVLRWVESGSGTQVSAWGFREIELNGIRVTCVTLGIPLIFLSHVSGGDDFPYSIAEKVWSVQPHCAVIDAHNCLRDITCTSLDTELLLRTCKAGEVGHVKIGVASVKSSLPDLEVGLGGVVALVLDLGGSTHYVVCFDSNNMVEGLREHIARGIKSLGLGSGVVATTDTHAMTGVRPKVDYYPLGSLSGWRRVVEEAVKAVKEALSKKRAVSRVVYTRLKYRCRVLDREKLEKMSEITLKSTMDVLKALVAGFLLSLIPLLL